MKKKQSHVLSNLGIIVISCSGRDRQDIKIINLYNRLLPQNDVWYGIKRLLLHAWVGDSVHLPTFTYRWSHDNHELSSRLKIMIIMLFNFFSKYLWIKTTTKKILLTNYLLLKCRVFNNRFCIAVHIIFYFLSPHLTLKRNPSLKQMRSASLRNCQNIILSVVSGKAASFCEK